MFYVEPVLELSESLVNKLHLPTPECGIIPSSSTARTGYYALFIPTMAVCVIFIGISVWYAKYSGVGIIHPRTLKAGILYMLSGVALVCGVLGSTAIAAGTELHWTVLCGVAVLSGVASAVLSLLYGYEQQRAIKVGE